MPTDWQLRWVQANRGYRWRVLPVGDLAQKFWRTCTFRRLKNYDKIQEVLETVLDSTLASHCTVGELAGDTLMVRVDDPSVGHYLRTEKRAVLLRALAKLKGSAKIREIRFLFHADGNLGTD